MEGWGRKSLTYYNVGIAILLEKSLPVRKTRFITFASDALAAQSYAQIVCS
jgi:hypothetical protein